MRPLDKGPGAPLPPTLVFIAGFLCAWALQRWLPSPIDNGGAGGVQRWAGVLLLVGGMLLFLWGLRTFARARTGIMLQKPALRVVEAGPYRWSRNPMYVGFVAMYLGGSLLVNSAWPLVILPLVILVVVVAVIAREERYMRASFGTAYDDYCRRVGRWF